jgi:hypothetical protein
MAEQRREGVVFIIVEKSSVVTVHAPSLMAGANLGRTTKFIISSLCLRLLDTIRYSLTIQAIQSQFTYLLERSEDRGFGEFP